MTNGDDIYVTLAPTKVIQVAGNRIGVPGPTGPAGGVNTFNGRSGAVVSASADYVVAQVTGAMDKAQNLADVANAATARGNLGLGSVATHALTDLLQLFTGANVQLQFGTTTGLTANNGFTLITVALGSSWPNNHLLWLGLISAASTNIQQITQVRAAPNGLNQGVIGVLNANASAQTVSVQWLSLGN